MTMQLLYCGWNGFGQVSKHCESALTTFTHIETEEPVTSVSCSWSALCIVSGSRLYMSGFIDGAANNSKILSLSNGESFKQVINNCKHVVAVSHTRKLWRRSVATSRENSQFLLLPLGELSTEEDSKDFVQKITCSDNICLALTNSGSLYAIPSRVNDPALVVTDIACGNEHTVFITAPGSVYTYGQGSRGQLGHGELEAEEEPREIHALAGLRMRQVSCGGWHSVVVSEEGDLYAWGWNRFGQLGVAEDNTREPQPKRRRRTDTPQSTQVPEQKVPSMSNKKETADPDDSANENGAGGVFALPQLIGWTEKRVVALSCGTRHTVVLLEDGTLWGCGWNAYGQLGISPDTNPQRTSMTQIPLPTHQKINSVICGGWSTCLLVS